MSESVRNRLGFGVVLLAALALSSPASAGAGTYTVVACEAAAGANDSFSARADPGMLAYAKCPSGGRQGRGLVMRNDLKAQPVALRHGASMIFDAPPGARLSAIDYVWRGRRGNGEWTMGLVGDRGRLITGCRARKPSTTSRCSVGVGKGQPKSVHVPLVGQQSVSFDVRCGMSVGCSASTTKARLQVYSAKVTVRDESRPNVATAGGEIWEPRWLRGAGRATFSATDNVGIETTRFLVDGQARSEDRRGCDYTRRVPCSNVWNASYHLNTAELADGVHTVSVQAVDTAGNPAETGQTISVDNSAPARIGDLSLDGGSEWRSTNSFTARWTIPPGQAAPVVRAHYQLCRAGTRTCSTGTQEGPNPSQLTDLRVPAPGEYALRVWLEDQAGNVDSSNASDPVVLRFDDVPPGEARLDDRNGWIGAAEAADYEQGFLRLPLKDIPISGLLGYSVTVDGTDPDATVETTASTVRLGPLKEGVVVVKARAVSGAGVPSRDIGSTEVKVDRSAPEAEIEGAPDGTRWRVGPVDLTVTGIDQPSLSGMAPAQANRPVDTGGYVVLRLNGGEPRRIRGDRAEIRVAADGLHTLTYRAVDVAGNESPERRVDFKLDSTAPEQVAFEPQDAADPRKVVVTALDQTSGVTAAGIEARRLGTGEWTPLDTTRDGDRFTAYFDDVGESRGIYEFRARAVDAAGNETISDRRSDGSKMELSNPVRSATSLVLSVSPHRRRARRPASNSKPVQMPFGRSVRVIGRLIGPNGEGLEAERVALSVRPASVGSAFRDAGVVETEAAGRFGATLPGGPSQTIRASFDGAPALAPSASYSRTRVRASSTLVSSRGVVPAYGAATFSGRLRGGHVPPGGKLVEIQAHFRNEWRTFKTVHSRPNGTWRYTYRFSGYREAVRFPFRARIPKEAAYPYDVGYSPVRSVTLRAVPSRRRRR